MDFVTTADSTRLYFKDWQDAVLVGFSMGGGEVARYMSRHGGRSASRCRPA